MLFGKALSAASAESIAEWSRLKLLGFSSQSLQISGLTASNREACAKDSGLKQRAERKCRRDRRHRALQHSCFPIPVRQHCALTVSIVTSNGGSYSEARKKGWRWRGR